MPVPDESKCQLKTYTLGSFGYLTLPSLTAESLFLPSSKEMQELDQRTIAAGTPALELMERAGQAVSREISRLAGNDSARITVLCGPGNNGGDGLVVCRLLTEAGFNVEAVIVPGRDFSPECSIQIDRAILAAVQITHIQREQRQIEQLHALLQSSSIIVDALLGTGQSKAPRELMAIVIEAVVSACKNDRSIRVVSVDIPTGVDADTGAVFNPHITADVTVAIQTVKRGMMQFPARSACGHIVIAPIGIDMTEDAEASPEYTLGGIYEQYELPQRGAADHKGTAGQVAIIAGSMQMPGAAALVALGALSTGIGLVRQITKRAWNRESVPVEVVTRFLSHDSEFFSATDSTEAIAALDRVASCVIGPGIGTDAGTGEFARAIIRHIFSQSGPLARQSALPLVIDADALTILAARPIELSSSVIITPHPAEAARLLGSDTKTVQQDRFRAAAELARRYKCIVILKGAGTIIHNGSIGRIICRGTPYLGTGGTGDVLSGILGALLARGIEPFRAAEIGAYIHAHSGEMAASQSQGPIVASDIARMVPVLVGALEKGRAAKER